MKRQEFSFNGYATPESSKGNFRTGFSIKHRSITFSAESRIKPTQTGNLSLITKFKAFRRSKDDRKPYEKPSKVITEEVVKLLHVNPFRLLSPDLEVRPMKPDIPSQKPSNQLQTLSIPLESDFEATSIEKTTPLFRIIPQSSSNPISPTEGNRTRVRNFRVIDLKSVKVTTKSMDLSADSSPSKESNRESKSFQSIPLPKPEPPPQPRSLSPTKPPKKM